MQKKRREKGDKPLIVYPPAEPLQPSPFDYVSSMRIEDRIDWCISMLSALFAAKGARVYVCPLGLLGPPSGKARSGSLDLESSMDSSMESDCGGVESSQDLVR